jgi:hypothetical protein
MKTKVYERIILIWILKEYDARFVDWIHQAQDGNQWWALVNMVRDQQVP